MEFYNDWMESKKALFDDQKKRYEKEIENGKKLNELNAKYDLIKTAYDQLSDEQKEMLKNVPRTEEEWDEFNQIGIDLERKNEKMDAIFDEMEEVIDELPFTSEELDQKFKAIAMEVMKKHHLNN